VTVKDHNIKKTKEIEEYYLLGCYAVLFGRSSPTFRRKMLPHICFANRILLTGYLFDLLFDPEEGGNMLLRNICGLLQAFTVLHPSYVRTSNPARARRKYFQRLAITSRRAAGNYI
jgi:hypothetical protein